jgi:hypothetical protein|tara:strand:+ start:361 stop:1023 length:663 start_codon:yes stop_codon:yes gene_type:complete
LEYGRVIQTSTQKSKQTRQYDNRNTGRSIVPSVAQRRLQAGPDFVVQGRPGDGGGTLALPTNIDEPDVWNGWSPLMCASASGHLAIVELLLGAGANPMFPSRDEHRMTAAHVAAQQGRFKVLRRLLEINPKVLYRKNKSSSAMQRQTPFHLACETDRYGMVQWLLENDTTEDHRLVGVITEDDENGYVERVVDLLAQHRKTHKDQKFMLKAQQMRAELGF